MKLLEDLLTLLSITLYNHLPPLTLDVPVPPPPRGMVEFEAFLRAACFYMFV